MEGAAEKALVLTLLVSILIGLLVIVFDSEYRMPAIIASNSFYYPNVYDDEIKKYALKYKRPTSTYTKPKFKKYKSYKYKSYKYKKYKSYNKYKKSYKKKFSGIVNINKATKEELMKIPGIGPYFAKKIIFYRKLHKGFKTKEELKKIPRMTESKYKQIEKYITVE